MITAKLLTLLERQFGVLSRRAVSLSFVSKEVLVTGLSKNKGLPMATTTTTMTMKKILTQARSEIQLRNGVNDGCQLNDLKVALSKPKAKNLPARTSLVNVGVWGITRRPAKNSKKWMEVQNVRETWHCHYNFCSMVRYATFRQTRIFFYGNLAIYFPFLLALFTIFTLFTLLILSFNNRQS